VSGVSARGECPICTKQKPDNRSGFTHGGDENVSRQRAKHYQKSGDVHVPIAGDKGETDKSFRVEQQKGQKRTEAG